VACTERDAHCPVCISNVTLNRNFTQHRCTSLPNPLVRGAGGLCCPQSVCEQWQCPVSCEADAGASFARAIYNTKQPPSPMENYDCSRTPAAKRCAKSMAGAQGAADCGCLVRDCLSAAKLLDAQPSQCVLECQEPASAQICADYDDETTFCEYSAVLQCVSTAASCNATKSLPHPTACEAACTAKSKAASTDPAQQLDSFLQCVGACPRESERSALASGLEA